MSIVSCGWLQRMADKSGTSAETRIQAVFQILQDWIDVPDIRQQLQSQPLDGSDRAALQSYLQTQLHNTKVKQPAIVAIQLQMVLLGALSEELRNPGSQALVQGQHTAKVLIRAQTPNSIAFRSMAVAAAVLVVLGSFALLLPQSQYTPQHAHPLQVAIVTDMPASPDQVAKIYHLHEQLQAANCSYPQALMLAPEQRAPFLDRVVNGSTDKLQPGSIMMINQLYQKVDCYYPPAAMLL